jgi:hypothetical protein
VNGSRKEMKRRFPNCAQQRMMTRKVIKAGKKVGLHGGSLIYSGKPALS